MKEYARYAQTIREEIHMYPEIGFDLPKTLAVVHRELDSMGIAYTDKWGRSSVVGYVGAADAPITIGLRADMDALPIQEMVDVPFKSRHDGIMHACGHDAHTAILIAAAKALKDRESELNCTVKLIFCVNSRNWVNMAKSILPSLSNSDCCVRMFPNVSRWIWL